eukprot:1176873-Prorocentrum_minimum.AAC.3
MAAFRRNSGAGPSGGRGWRNNIGSDFEDNYRQSMWNGYVTTQSRGLDLLVKTAIANLLFRADGATTWLLNAYPAFGHRYGTTKTKPSLTLFVANIPHKAWFERVEAVFMSDPGITNVRQAKRLTMVFVDYEDIASATKSVPAPFNPTLPILFIDCPLSNPTAPSPSTSTIPVQLPSLLP